MEVHVHARVRERVLSYCYVGGSPIVELSKALPAPGTDTYIITGSRLQRS